MDMRKFLVVFALLIVAVFAANYETDEGVIVLTEANFDEVVNSMDNVLVEFYAPWCGHCKNLAPHYAKAAQNSDFNLAKVDATENGALAQRFGVRGYPTLKFFEGNVDTFRDYTGGRTEDTLLSWLKKNTVNELDELSSQEAIDAFIDTNERAVIYYTTSDDHSSVISAHRQTDFFEFAVVTDSTLVGDNEGKIVLHVDFTDDVATHDVSEGNILEFLNNNGFDIVVQFEREHYPRLMENHDWLVIVVVDYNDNKDDVVEFLREVATENTNFAITYGDKAVWGNTAAQVGASGTKFPTAIAIGTPQGETAQQQIVFDESNEFTKESFAAWLPTLVDGSYSVFVKSEPIPESNDGPVKVIVAKSYDDFVDGSKNVFIKYYAPWCGHCKNLIPVWNELGEHFENNDQVVIAKLDATANQVDKKFGVTGFPTLILNKADGSFVKYDGARDFDSLKDWVYEQTGLSESAHAHDEL